MSAWQGTLVGGRLAPHLSVQLNDINSNAVLLKPAHSRAHTKPNSQCALAGPNQPAVVSKLGVRRLHAVHS